MVSHLRQRYKAAVIGAGVSGLIVAKRLKAEGLEVIVYERQSGPGGVWKFTQNATDKFASPVYGSLETNFPRELMEVSDSPWEDWVSLFPKREMVEKYLQAYSKGTDVRYDHEVVELFPRTARQPNTWRLKTRDTKSDKETILDFDYVVMATGTFTRPFRPSYPGLEEWEKMYPNTSGLDISLQLSNVVQKLWVSSTRPNGREYKKAKNVKGVNSLVAKNRLVKFEENEEARDVDNILFCTGYMYTSSFLRKGMRASDSVFPDGFYVPNLYEHIFWTAKPSLAFIGIPKGGPTFLISQAQGAVIARAFSPRVVRGLTITHMKAWVEEENTKWNKRRQRGETDEKSFHTLGYPNCKEYIDRLEQWCLDEDEHAVERAPEGKSFIDYNLNSGVAIFT
ncbi:FAD/NAD(P)-binding domain-containing protein [Hypoxylon sp. FL0890]|nr:FAD/NAD(P)-binding domain-containing protein [Hypoxylon sp. FL0890]